MSFWASLGTSALSSLFGGSRDTLELPVDTSVSLSPSSAPPDPQDIAEQENNMFGEFMDSFEKQAGGAIGSSLTASMRGKATKKFTDAAFPGTTPWEQLGSGASGAAQQGALAGQELQQRERESKRQAETSMKIAQTQSAAELMKAFMAQFGSSGAAETMKMIMATGMFPNIDVRQMGQSLADAQKVNLGAQTGLINEQTATEPFRRENIQSDTFVNDSLGQLNFQKKDLDLAQYALDAYGRIYGYSGTELMGILQIVKNGLGDDTTDRTAETLFDRIMSVLEKEHGKGSAFKFSEVLSDVRP